MIRKFSCLCCKHSDGVIISIPNSNVTYGQNWCMPKNRSTFNDVPCWHFRFDISKYKELKKYETH